MKIFNLALKAGIGIAAIILGAEKIGSAVNDVKDGIREKHEPKVQETTQESEE